TARGCTEAEAMEAAAKVAELMREHGLSHEELEMTQEAAGVKPARALPVLYYGRQLQIAPIAQRSLRQPEKIIR
ncbi:DUF2786 domain-containing protein, partial [Ochrobactrum sp. SFR4]|uniref:DUF2786 domain-containing protein n=1 Tax=Ochrobactrum sp. SFR4 TaxID=2717368 RepID=UPI001C8C99AB